MDFKIGIPGNTARTAKALKIGVGGVAQTVKAAWIGDSTGRARQIWPLASAPDISGMTLTLTTPITAGETGTLRASGAVSTDSGSITYQIMSVSTTNVTASKTTGIGESEDVTITASAAIMTETTVMITVRAVSSSGAVSGNKTVSATVVPAVTVTAPSASGGGQINSGENGSINIYGSVASDGTAVTYEVTGYTNITSISPTTGIGENGEVSYSVSTLTSSGTYRITIRAKSESGHYSEKVNISGTVYVPVETIIYDKSPPVVIPGSFGEYINVPRSGTVICRAYLGDTLIDERSKDVLSGDIISIAKTYITSGYPPVVTEVVLWPSGSSNYTYITSVDAYDITRIVIIIV